MASHGLNQLGAGDLIDRAVRFYRKFFWTFILIAAPPIVAGTAISLLWNYLGRQIFAIGGDPVSLESTIYYLFMWLGTVFIWFVETIATLIVMGGASRNFARHLLFDEAITFRQTYSNVRSRFFSLLAAAALITLLVGAIGFAVFYFGMLAAAIAVLAVAYILSELSALAVTVSIIVGSAVAIATIWGFFLAASRLAYVPQVIMVEGQGIFSALGRSATLAKGSLRSLIVLFVFTLVATYSALALLYVPVGWYASANGVELFSFDADLVPAWYEIASNLMWQISLILLSPVWMIGLCLLYVNARIRNEGYDIELMAAARLGDIPSVPERYINPLQPALSSVQTARVAPVGAGKGVTTLGLTDDQ